MPVLWLAVAALACACGAGGARPPPVDVLKCCRVGETLVAADAGGGWRCRAGGSALWAPLVYAPLRRTFLPRGDVPKHWRVREARRPDCAALRLVSTQSTSDFLLFTNGSLYLPESMLALPPDGYCADGGAALVCTEPEPEERRAPPVHKCCYNGSAYDRERKTCAGEPAATGAEMARRLRAEVEGGGEPRVASGFPHCAAPDAGYAVVGAPDAARLLPNGSLVLEDTELAAGGYCVEFWARSGLSAVVLACPELVPAATAAPGRHALYGAGLAVGAAFLAATLAAGFLLPAAHHALHWRCQTHYVAALLLGDVLLAATQLAGNAVPPAVCVSLAVCMHFLFLSAFFWLNTMCFNIWWTFRDFRPTSLERSQESCRLHVYMLYAWGGPLLIAGVAAVLDHLPPDPAYTFLRPRFGEQRCWFFGDMEILTYFFGPVGVLLCVNLVLFVSTTRQLTCGLWRRDEVKSTSERAALGRVCAKLVVVMGVTWVADVVSWGAGGPDYVWYVTDLVNALQGVFIFVVVGCQPQVWASVKRARCLRRWRGGAGRAGAGAPLHSSSQLPSCGESVTHTTAHSAPHKLPMETVC